MEITNSRSDNQIKGFYSKRIKVDMLFIGMLLMIVTSICNTSKYGASLSWVLLPSILIIVGGLLNRESIKKKQLWLFFFYFSCLFSTVISDDVVIERDVITFFAFILVYVFATNRDYTRYEICFMITTYIIVAFLCSINILINWVSKNYYIAYYHRASFLFFGVYKDPNYVMSYISPAAFFVLFRIIKASSIRNRIVYIGLFSVIAMSYIATASRGSLIAILLAILVYIFLSIVSQRNYLKKLVLFIIVLAIIILISWLTIRLLPQQSVVRLFNMNDSLRISIWENALVVFKKHPFLGDGMRSASSWTRQTNRLDSHNVYIDILCNFGIVGMLLFMIFFVKNCYRHSKEDHIIIIPSIITFMFTMLFINGFNTMTFYLPLIMLGIFSNYSLSKHNLSQIV